MIKKISYFFVVVFLFTLFVNKNTVYANQENKLGLYGITLDSTLEDIINIAKAKKFEIRVRESCMDQKLEEIFINSQLDRKNLIILSHIHYSIFHSCGYEFCIPGTDCKKIDKAMRYFEQLAEANRLRKYVFFPIVLERKEELDGGIITNEITILMIYDKNEQKFKIAYFILPSGVASKAVDILGERFGSPILKNVPYGDYYNYWEKGDDVAVVYKKETLIFYRKKIFDEFLNMSLSEFDYAINEDKNEKIRKEKEEKERYRKDM